MLGGHTLQRASPLTADAAALQVPELSLSAPPLLYLSISPQTSLYLHVSPQVFELSLSAAAARAVLVRAAPPRLGMDAPPRPARPVEVLVRLAELLYAPLLAAEDLPRAP